MIVYDFAEALRIPRPTRDKIVLLRIPMVGRGPTARLQLRAAILSVGKHWYGTEINLRETPVGPQWTLPVGVLSLSYDGLDGWAAWSEVTRLGCDAIRINDFTERADITQRYLGATVAARLATSRLPSEAFAHEWTKFEASLKAYGLTLTEDLSPLRGRAFYHRCGEVVVAVFIDS